MGKPKKHQSSDAAADELNLETLKDEGKLVSTATLKQMLDVQQSMLKMLSIPLPPLSMQESISWQIQSRLSKQALNLQKRMSEICRP